MQNSFDLSQQTPHSVLIVGNFLSDPLGYRSVCEDFAEHLAKMHWNVFTTSNRPGRLVRMLDMLYTTWSKRNQFEIATIDTFSGPAFIWAERVGYALRNLGKPFVLILHGGNLPGFASLHPARVTRLLNSAASVTAPSHYLVEQMQPYRPDILLLPNPLEIPRYKFIRRTQPGPVLVWLRAFHSIYNPLLAVQTLACLVALHPTARLLMAGEDKKDGSFQKVTQLVKTLDLSDKVELPGRIPNSEVPSWLQKADIFINTTNIDNTPISVLEAMACGLCVVSTKVGGIPYLLEDGQDAILVPANDPGAMASAVHRILTGPGLAERLSTNARRKAEQFDWSIICDQWNDLFIRILEGENNRTKSPRGATK